MTVEMPSWDTRTGELPSDRRPRVEVVAGYMADVVMALSLLMVALSQACFQFIRQELQIGEYSVYPPDILAVAAVLVSLATLLARSTRQELVRVRVVLAFVAVVYLMLAMTMIVEWRGADAQAAVSAWRQQVHVAAMLILGLTWGFARGRVWRKILLAGGWLFLVMLVYTLFVQGWAWGRQYSEANPLTGAPAAFYGARPLDASASLVIVAALAVAVFDVPLTNTRIRMASIVLLTLGVVYTQVRSAWVATAVVLVAGVFHYVRTQPVQRNVTSSIIVASLLACVVAVSPVLSGLSLLPTANSAVYAETSATQTSASKAGVEHEFAESSVESHATLDWRVDRWREHRLTLDRPSAVLFGVTLGGSQIEPPVSSAHSQYMRTLTDFGLVGLGILVFGIAYAVTRSRSATVWISFTYALAAFGFFYDWPPWSWAVFGAAVVAAPRHPVSALPSQQLS